MVNSFSREHISLLDIPIVFLDLINLIKSDLRYREFIKIRLYFNVMHLLFITLCIAGFFVNKTLCIGLIVFYVTVGSSLISRDRRLKIEKAVTLLRKFSDCFERDIDSICNGLSIPYLVLSDSIIVLYVGKGKVVIGEKGYR